MMSSGAAEWRKFANKLKHKRQGRKQGTGGDGEEIIPDELIVQRMTADVCGKQQKYTRIRLPRICAICRLRGVDHY